MVAITSAAPSVEPSWKRTPSRSTKVHVALLAPAVYDSARSPSTPPVAVRRVRLLYRFTGLRHSLPKIPMMGWSVRRSLYSATVSCPPGLAWPCAEPRRTPGRNRAPAPEATRLRVKWRRVTPPIDDALRSWLASSTHATHVEHAQ